MRRAVDHRSTAPDDEMPSGPGLGARKPTGDPIGVELQVRDAKLTDIDRITTLLALGDGHGLEGARPDDVADLLRQLVYLPNATLLVALDGRQVVGASVLALRPSVRHRGLVGTVDLLVTDPGTAHDGIAGVLLAEQLRSARNKGCSRVEIELPDDPSQQRLLDENDFVDGHPMLVRPTARASVAAP